MALEKEDVPEIKESKKIVTLDVTQFKPLEGFYLKCEVKDASYHHMTALSNDRLALIMVESNEVTLLVILNYIPSYHWPDGFTKFQRKSSVDILDRIALPNFHRPYLYGLPDGRLIISEIKNDKNISVVFDLGKKEVVGEIDICITQDKMPIIYNHYLASISENTKSVLIYDLHALTKKCLTLELEDEVIALVAKPEINGLVVILKNKVAKIYRETENVLQLISEAVPYKKLQDEYRQLLSEQNVALSSNFASTYQVTYCPSLGLRDDSVKLMKVLHHGKFHQSITVTCFDSGFPTLIESDANPGMSLGYVYGKTCVFLDDDFIVVNFENGAYVYRSLAAKINVDKIRNLLGIEKDSSLLTYYEREITKVDKMLNDIRQKYSEEKKQELTSLPPDLTHIQEAPFNLKPHYRGMRAADNEADKKKNQKLPKYAALFTKTSVQVVETDIDQFNRRCFRRRPCTIL
ncbi:MAG: hypothetical protein ABI597_00080 [Gammaproteobacteria bacterium]